MEVLRRQEEKERRRQEEAQRLREQLERQRQESPPARAKAFSHAERRAEAKAAARARLEEMIASGQLVIRRLTAADLERLEVARARRVSPYAPDGRGAA